MGVPDSSLLDLIKKVRFWVSWGGTDPSSLSCEFSAMSGNGSKMCCDCHTKLTQLGRSYHCQNCNRNFCARCFQGCSVSTVGKSDGNLMKKCIDIGENIEVCKFCSEVNMRKCSEKVYPTPSQESLELPFRSGVEYMKFSDNFESSKKYCLAPYDESRDHGNSSHTVSPGAMTSFSGQLSPVHSHRSPSRSDDEEAGDSGRHRFSLSSDYCHDNSDIDTGSASARYEPYQLPSLGSSPIDSPSRIDFVPSVGPPVQRMEEGSFQSVSPHDHESTAVLNKPDLGTEDPAGNTDNCSNDLSTFQYGKLQKPLDFENNGLIWTPPPPEDEDDEMESNFFEDDDDDIGYSGATFSSSSSFSTAFPTKEKQNEGHKEPLRAVIQGHFRALVSQLLQSEGINGGEENSVEEWLDVVTALALQAANFVKPDTSRGGSMDPCDYVKVKCIASGSPRDSTFVKGVVCTKNIKHKRMTSQYKNPRLLILGGALEYQRVPNQLASFDTILQQENDHFKMIISKIEALHPNVLLVEKSVSTYAQEHLLGKEISLVLNVKRSLLERIARCTGASITPSVDNISTTRLGHCELFRLDRVFEEHEASNQSNKRNFKTLMFFEGCPRRLGCTVLLRGACREELKKVKHVILYAVFAAYHLSLETSFLADEGATLPKMTVKHSASWQDKAVSDDVVSATPASGQLASHQDFNMYSMQDEDLALNPEHDRPESSLELLNPNQIDIPFSSDFVDRTVENEDSDTQKDDLASDMVGLDGQLNQHEASEGPVALPSELRYISELESQWTSAQEERHLEEARELLKAEKIDEGEVSSEYFSAADTHQSILVSFSSRCVLKETVCERSRLLRIKFYGSFDKPLGRYLHDDLFDQYSRCHSCQEPAEAHVLCYTHPQGNLTINVKRLTSSRLPGERDGKIWMWHRCLRCAHIDGVPPATRRVVMSDAAWGLSFGKFLELSFSNHATANRVAPCGHSLQKDCLRYYGFGSMVAFFRYSPIDILSVHLPPSVLQFDGPAQHEWIRKEAAEAVVKVETLYTEISSVLNSMEKKCKSSENEVASELQKHIIELKEQLKNEQNDYNKLLQPTCMMTSKAGQAAMDSLELNGLIRSLLISSHVWDRRLYSLDSLIKTNPILEATVRDGQLQEVRNGQGGELVKSSLSQDSSGNEIDHMEDQKSVPFEEGSESDSDVAINNASNLSERIDSLWTGTEQVPLEAQTLNTVQGDGLVGQMSRNDNPPFRRLMVPMRVHSFDSALRIQERIRKGLPPSSLHLSTLRSFHAFGDFRNMVRDPVSNVTRTHSQILPLEAQKLNLIVSSPPSFIPSASHLADGVRLLLPQTGCNDIVIAIYDSEPTSIISYALSSKEYEEWVSDKSVGQGGWNASESDKEASVATSFSAWQSFGSLDLEYIHYGTYGTEDVSSSMNSLFSDSKKSPHLRISFLDESVPAVGKIQFSVTCYFAKEFDSLRKKCCPSELDFLRSLSRCKKWSAQGGKSNVYFAKTLDERFIIKQVTKTELESFEEFAPEYFKYLADSLSYGSPSCLAKVLGIYQVSVKHPKGGKETRMDLMVMENLFFGRSISRVYDLKGSARSRYNPDSTGPNKVLLDMNLLETLRTNPIFLGRKAKRSLERAVWNDTFFLASVDVMDYSLLVGVDEDRKELVLGIIDYMRQYTWDKHLETWVKASGILGGPKNASPTIISPKQYKKRFRKAMTAYFLTVPDQWSS